MANCPACGSRSADRFLSVSAKEAAQHFIAREANRARHDALAAHIERLWGVPTCTLRDCRDCGFGFSDPYVAGDGTFYNLAYERPTYPVDKWDFSRTIDDLTASRLTAARILEVGAGDGFFLDKIAGRFVPASGITATDYNDEALTEMRRKGYHAIGGDLRAADLESGFDAIFLFQVVEHMDDLPGLFHCVADLLARHGVAYVTVPNKARNRFNEAHGSLIDMPPNHIGQWTEAAFREVVGETGLRLDAFERAPPEIGDFIRKDISYSYLRGAQRGGTLENYSRRLRNYPLGKLAGAAVAALLAPRRIPIWLEVSRRSDLGNAVWARFSKT